MTRMMMMRTTTFELRHLWSISEPISRRAESEIEADATRGNSTGPENFHGNELMEFAQWNLYGMVLKRDDICEESIHTFLPFTSRQTITETRQI